jgi:hypothetical protein
MNSKVWLLKKISKLINGSTKSTEAVYALLLKEVDWTL